MIRLTLVAVALGACGSSTNSNNDAPDAGTGDGFDAGGAAVCGDGVVSGDEVCDTAIADGDDGACPTQCDDQLACTQDVLLGVDCAAECSTVEITACASGDGCCPLGCSSSTDDDCPPPTSLGDPTVDTGNGVSDTGVWIQNPALAIDSNGLPVLAYTVALGDSREVYLKRWDGTAWVELGGSATGGGISNTACAGQFCGNSTSPAVAVDSQNRPVVSWSEAEPPRIYARRWSGSAWEELDGSATGQGLLPDNAVVGSHSAIAIDSSDRIIVAWQAADADSNMIQLKRFNGTVWEELDGSAQLAGVGGAGWRPHLAMTGSETFAIVSSTSMEVYEWNGTTFVDLDSASLPAGDSLSDTAIAYDAVAGELHIAYESGAGVINSLRWDGTEWTDQTTELALSCSGFCPSGVQMAPDPTGGVVIVWNWSKYSTGVGTPYPFYGRHYDGVSWTDLASDPNDGPAGQFQFFTAVAVSPGGEVHVAWDQDLGSLRSEVYLRTLFP